MKQVTMSLIGDTVHGFTLLYTIFGDDGLSIASGNIAGSCIGEVMRDFENIWQDFEDE